MRCIIGNKRGRRSVSRQPLRGQGPGRGSRGTLPAPGSSEPSPGGDSKAIFMHIVLRITELNKCGSFHLTSPALLLSLGVFLFLPRNMKSLSV